MPDRDLLLDLSPTAFKPTALPPDVLTSIAGRAPMLASGPVALADIQLASDASLNITATGCSWVAGPNAQFPYAVQFDGISQSATTPDNAILRTPSNQVTLEFWGNIKTLIINSNTYVNTFISKKLVNNVANSFAAHLYTTGGVLKPAFNLGTTGTADYTYSYGSKTILANTWNHYVMVWDGIYTRIYINGVLDSTGATVSGILNYAAKPLVIGFSVANNTYNNVAVAGIKLYSRALEATEAMEHFTGVFANNRDLVASWDCQENTGLILSGKTTKTAFQAVPTSWTSTDGRFGSGLGLPSGVFSSTQGLINLGNNLKLQPSSFTASCWIYPTSWNSNGSTLLVSRWMSGSSSSMVTWLLSCSSSGGLGGYINTTKFSSQTGGLVVLNTWNHVAMTFDGGVGNIYLNGILVSTGSESPLVYSSDNFGIGCIPGTPGYQFNGRIQDVLLYSRALSASEVLALAKEAPVSPHNLVLDMPLNEATSSTLVSSRPVDIVSVPQTSQAIRYLEGSTQTLQILDSPSTRPIQDMTLEFWYFQTRRRVKGGTTQAWEVEIINKSVDTVGATAPYNYFVALSSLEYSSNDTLAWCPKPGNGTGARPTSATFGPWFPLNQWVHIVLTYDGARTRAYMNGCKLWEDTTASGEIFYNAISNGAVPPLSLCGGFSNEGGMGTSRCSPVRISNFKLYHRTLSDSEVLQRYRGIYTDNSRIMVDLGQETLNTQSTSSYPATAVFTPTMWKFISNVPAGVIDAVSDLQSTWVITSSNTLYRGVDGVWSQVSLPSGVTVQQLQSSPLGSLWILSTTGNLHKFANNSWTKLPKPPLNIMTLGVDSLDRPWVTTYTAGAPTTPNIWYYAGPNWVLQSGDCIASLQMPITLPSGSITQVCLNTTNKGFRLWSGSAWIDPNASFSGWKDFTPGTFSSLATNTFGQLLALTTTGLVKAPLISSTPSVDGILNIPLPEASPVVNLRSGQRVTALCQNGVILVLDPLLVGKSTTVGSDYTVFNGDTSPWPTTVSLNFNVTEPSTNSVISFRGSWSDATVSDDKMGNEQVNYSLNGSNPIDVTSLYTDPTLGELITNTLITQIDPESLIYPGKLPKATFNLDPVTSLLLHFNGANGSSSFTDETGKAVSVVTGSPVISNAQSKFGSTSGYFNGSSAVKVPYSAAFDLSSGDWTLEAWFYPLAYGGAIISKDTYGSNFDWHIGFSSSTTFEFATNGTNNRYIVTVPEMSLNKWYHIALVRASGVLHLFLNGIRYGSGFTVGITNVSQSNITIGCCGWNSPNYFFKGYLSELRVSKFARYSATGVNTIAISTVPQVSGYRDNLRIWPTIITSNKPASTPVNTLEFKPSLSSSGQIATSSVVDTVTNNVTFTAANLTSGNVHPTLTAPVDRSILRNAKPTVTFTASEGKSISTGLLSTNTGDFTIAAWVKPGNTLQYGYSSDVYVEKSKGITILASNISAAMTGFCFGIRNDANNVLEFHIPEGSINYRSSASISLGSWTHIAAVYSSLTGKLSYYINGVLDSSQSITAPTASTTLALSIAARSWGYGFFDGSMSQFLYANRALTSVEVNNHMLDLPIDPTNVILDLPLTETSGLTCFNKVAPNATTATYFNGSSSKLVATNVPPQLQLKNNISIELWANLTNPASSTSGQILCCLRGSATGGSYFGSGHIVNPSIGTPGLNLAYNEGLTGANCPSTGFKLTPNRWTHIVLSYDGTFSRLFIDGTLVYSQYQTLGPIQLSSSTILEIGSWNQANTWTFQGCLQGLKIWGHALSPDEVALRYKDQNLNLKPVLSLPLDVSTTQTVPVNSTVESQTQALSVNRDAIISKSRNHLIKMEGVPATPSAFTYFADITLKKWQSYESLIALTTASTWGGFQHVIDSSGTNLIGISVADRFSISTAPSQVTPLNTRVKIVFVYDNGLATLYKDGKLIAKTGSIAPVWTFLKVIEDLETSEACDADIYKIQLYNKALGSSDIARLNRGLKPLLGKFKPKFQPNRLSGCQLWVDAKDLDKISPTVTYGAAPSWTTGPTTWFPYAVKPAANSAAVSMSPRTLSKVFTYNMSMELWFKQDTQGSYQWLVGKRGTTDGSKAPYMLLISNTGIPYLNFQVGSSLVSLAAPSAVSTGSWNHICFTWDGFTGSLYLNGSLVSSTKFATALTAVDYTMTDSEFGIGLDPTSSSQYFKGAICGVRGYNRTLTASEVGLAYSSGKAAAGQVFAFDCQENSGSVLYDSCANNLRQTPGTITSPYTLTGVKEYSSSASHLTYGNSAPTLDYVNGLVGMKFLQGTPGWLAAANSTGWSQAGGYTILMVFTPTSVGGSYGHGLCGKVDYSVSTASRRKLEIFWSPTYGLKAQSGADSSSFFLNPSNKSALNVPKLAIVRVNAANSVDMFMDEQSSHGVSTFDITTNNAKSFILGAAGADATTLANYPSEMLNGLIHEAAVFNRPLTDSEVALARQYFASKWGVPSTISPNYPGNISDMKLWLDTSDTSFVSSTYYKDKSPSQNTIGVQREDLRPSLVTGQNGLNVLRFSGSQGLFTNLYAGQVQMPAVTIIGVWKPTIDATSRVLWSLDGSPSNNYQRSLLASSSGVTLYGGASANSISWLKGVDSSAHIFSSDFTLGSGYNLYVDGIQFAKGSAETANANNTPLTLCGSSNTSQYFNGDLCEVLVFSRVLTCTERLSIEGYLAVKWGIQTHSVQSINGSYQTPGVFGTSGFGQFNFGN